MPLGRAHAPPPVCGSSRFARGAEIASFDRLLRRRRRTAPSAHHWPERKMPLAYRLSCHTYYLFVGIDMSLASDVLKVGARHARTRTHRMCMLRICTVARTSALGQSRVNIVRTRLLQLRDAALLAPARRVTDPRKKHLFLLESTCSQR